MALQERQQKDAETKLKHTIHQLKTVMIPKSGELEYENQERRKEIEETRKERLRTNEVFRTLAGKIGAVENRILR